MSRDIARRTPEGEAATEVILTCFRPNGLLLAAGDVLAAEHGVTSARWQVVGAIALAERPLTVPQIARRMGLTRQSVHASVDRLVRDGLAEFEPNEDHRRSHLVRLTELGGEKLMAMRRLQASWVNRLADGISAGDLQTTARVISELCARLEADRSGDGGLQRGRGRPEIRRR